MSIKCLLLIVLNLGWKENSRSAIMEFNYMILQAYDFYKLFKDKSCILQIGGSDQWGNIVGGVDLIRRMPNQESLD